MAILCFENTIVLMFSILIYTGVLACEKLLDDEENAIALHLATILTIVNGVFSLIKSFLESRALKESLGEYILQNMIARQGWIPFIHLIKE